MSGWLSGPLRFLNRAFEVDDDATGVSLTRDAIVVLGAPLARDGGLSRVVAERIAVAVALYHAGGGTWFCVTGGPTNGPGLPAEAEVMAEAARAAGVPDDRLLVEAVSRTTFENACFTTRLLDERGCRTLWIVTTPFHQRRARYWFRHIGYDARVWPVPASVQYEEPWVGLRWSVREVAAWVNAAALTVRERLRPHARVRCAASPVASRADAASACEKGASR